MSTPAIGIDLGTTFSVVACYRNGAVEIIANDQGNRTTPSCVAFTDIERIIGEGAYYQSVKNPENTIYNIKRLMGRALTDEEVQEDMKSWPFKVVEENDKLKVSVSYKRVPKKFYPEEISAMILEKMKKTAEEYLGIPIKDVVVTVPAYFNNAQKQATKDAANIAGLNLIRLVNEPNAAAMAYGLNTKNVGRKNILVFDFGGGTFDVSILNLRDQKYTVRAINGDTHLGGEDIDKRLVDHFVQEFKRKFKRDITNDNGLMRNLKNQCERAKRILSTANKAEFVLEGTELFGNISRALFEDLCNDIFEKCIELVKKVLADAEMAKNDINDVVLVGGSSRIPRVREMLQEFFNGKQLSQNINPDEAVAYGAAILAASVQDQLADTMKGIMLSDVCPLSLGIAILDGSLSVVIKRNTPIPTKKTKRFSTTDDFQTSVSIKIYEGERLMAEDNHFLGKFTINNIPPGPRGMPVDVTIEIDANGIIKVTAVEPITGHSRNITISNKSLLSKKESESAVKQAEELRAEDEMHKKRLESFNAFERYLYDVKRKSIRLSQKNQKILKSKTDKMSEWLRNHLLASKAEFDQKKEELQEFCSKYGL